MRASVQLRHARDMRWRAALVGLPAFAIAGAFWLGTVALIFALQSAQCPAETFYSDSPAPQHVFVYASLLFPAILIVSTVYGQGTALLQSWQSPLEGDALQHRKARLRRAHRRNLKIFTILLAIALPVSVGFSMCQFCLVPEGVLYRPSPWSDLHTYAWQDVASIETSCWRGSRGSWHAGYIVTMRDGTAIDLMGSQREASRALPAVIHAMRDFDVAFDAHRVSRNCAAYGAELLRQRP